MQSDNSHDPIIDDPLFDRPAAAKYLNRKSSTLKWWDCKKRYDLKPIKMGKKIVLYRKSNLDKLLIEQLKPE